MAQNNNNTARQQQQQYAEYEQHADPVYSYIEGEDSGEGRKRSGAKMAMLFLIIGGLVGLGLFSYNKGRKEGTDSSLAVLNAPEGDYVRERPSDPQGADIPDQDKSVYSTVEQGQLTSPGGFQQLPTAQPQAPEDVASPAAQPSADKALLPSQIVGQAGETGGAPGKPMDVTSGAPVGLGTPMAIVPGSSSGNSGVNSRFSAPSAATPRQPQAEPAVPTDQPGGYTSGYSTAMTPPAEPAPVANPMPAPRQIAPLGKTSVPAAPAAAMPRPVTPAPRPAVVASIPPAAPKAVAGASRIQLVAVRGDNAVAAAAWRDLVARYPAMLSGLSPVYEAVPGKGMTRVKAAVSSPAAAASLCSRLKAAGQGCIVSR